MGTEPAHCVLSVECDGHEGVGYMARGLAIATAMLNPQAVIFGGRASPLFESAEADLRNQLSGLLVADTSPPAIVFSKVGREGPAIGAALTLHEKYFVYPESNNDTDG